MDFGLAPLIAAVTVHLSVAPGLKFDPPRFAAAPGEPVTVVFHNGDEMIHNFVVTRPGERLKVVSAALGLGADGPGRNFVPDLPEVLWHTRALNPGETDTLRFDAPSEPGVYPYVCTFPGHGFVMFGAMYVTRGPLPPLDKDPNVPPAIAAAASGSQGPGDGLLTVGERPRISRTFLPDCGPAAIAVGMPGGQSFVFDAGLCQLRYAWKGGFVDNTDQWDGKGDLWAKVVGRIYYRAPAGHWLRFCSGAREPDVRWRGYRLADGFPEFHYFLEGVEVWESERPLEGGSGLRITFEIPHPPGPVFFVTDPSGGAEFASSAGHWSQGRLSLTAAEAKRFTVTLTERPRVEPIRYWSMNDALWETNNVEPQPGVIGRAFTPGGLGSTPKVLATGIQTSALAEGGTLCAWVRLAPSPTESGAGDVGAGGDVSGAQPIFSAGSSFLVTPLWRDSAWHHVVVTLPAGGPSHTYLDGVDRGPSQLSLPAASAEIDIGSAGDRFLKGLIDEVRIYDRVLSAAEIQAMHQREAAAGLLLP